MGYVLMDFYHGAIQYFVLSSIIFKRFNRTFIPWSITVGDKAQ